MNNKFLFLLALLFLLLCSCDSGGANSVSEGNIGLHLTDWSTFDKTVCAIVLRAEDGTVLSGKEPTVAECEILR